MGIPYLDPSVEELLWLNNQSAPAIPQSPFFLPLVTSISEGRFPGSGTPTFTRAKDSYQTDFEGKLNLVPSGAARTQGTRIVQTQVTKSEDISGASWTLLGTAARTSNTLTYKASGDGISFVPVNSPLISGQVYVLRLTAHFISGDNTVNWRLKTDAGNSGSTFNITGATDLIYTSKITTSVGFANLQLTSVSVPSGDTVIGITSIMVVDLTGATNQNPPEYVSTEVDYGLGGPKGIAAFQTLNGNTVSSGVVTEATGAHIDSSQAAAAGGVTAGVVDATGPLGLLVERARTNDILQSNTLDTTWTVSNAADMNAVAADAYVSTDGTTTMDKLQPKATNAVHSLNQAFTFTAAKYTFAMDLRYVSATPQRWVALILNDGTTTWGASFDLSLGVVGAVSAGATSTIKATALAGVYRVSVTNTANAAAAAGTVKISLNATDTATLESAVRAGTETLGAGMVQHEVGTFASSPIPTTTVAVTRPADVLTYPSAGNVAFPATVYFEGAMDTLVDGGTSKTWFSIDDDSTTNDSFIFWLNGFGFGTNDIVGGVGEGDVVTANSPSAGVVFKVARTIAVNNLQIVLNGGTIATDVTRQVPTGITKIKIGSSGGSAGQPNGTIRNVRIYQNQIPAAQLQAITT